MFGCVESLEPSFNGGFSLSSLYFLLFLVASLFLFLSCLIVCERVYACIYVYMLIYMRECVYIVPKQMKRGMEGYLKAYQVSLEATKVSNLLNIFGDSFYKRESIGQSGNRLVTIVY